MERKDLYQTITDKIITALEAGVRPWHMPWAAGNTEGRIVRPLRHNGEGYNGINILMLWGEAVEKGYSSPYWMTFKQATEFGGHVRKGERGTMVVYASTYSKTEETDDGAEEERNIPFLKSYTVFNAEQIEELPERFRVSPAAPLDSVERIQAAEAFFSTIPADVRHGGGRAFYSITEDFIRLPAFEVFESPEAYYATRAHETAHWTRHPSRLDRDFGRKRWGDEGYAMEELVAEMAAAFVGAGIGIAPMVLDEHTAYIASWLKVLKGDKRAIITAASHAGKAADFLAGFHQGQQETIAA